MPFSFYDTIAIMIVFCAGMMFGAWMMWEYGQTAGESK